MTRLIRAELTKLGTTRLTYGLLATAVSLTGVFSVLEAARAGTAAVGPLTTAAGLNDVFTGGIWSLILATVLGVTVSSGEFRHGTATTTYLVTPRRDRVLAAKTIAAACAGAVFGLSGWLVATTVGLTFVAAHGDRLPVGVATIVRYAAGHIVAAALLAAIGAALGSLIRSQLAGIIGVFVWAIIIESIVGSLFHGIQPYLPYTAATTLAGSKLGGAAFGPAHDAVTAATPLPFAAATALLLAVLIVISAIAARTTVRRDVS
jgi:ABC-2 type transport system permease protein